MSGDAMHATFPAPPTSEGDIEKSTTGLASLPAPQNPNCGRTSFRTVEGLQPGAGRDEELQDALPSDGAGGGNAGAGRPAMSADGPKEFSRLKCRPGTEVFTELADVKSRTSWTAERRRLLKDMWNRGEKAVAGIHRIIASGSSLRDLPLA
jgi:hypothetical protein